MLRIERGSRTLRPIEKRPIPQAGLKERADLQQMIRNNPEAFFVEDRIDLLALDQHGAAVIIELKRGDHKLHLLQALAYAGMISRWGLEQLVAQRSNLTAKTSAEVKEEFEEFLLEEIEEVNQSQRVVLLAEGFDYEVLVTAKWLNEKHDVDIRCYRMTLAFDGGVEYLTCTCIYPPPEITEHAVKRGREGHPPEWEDWDKALETINNQAVEQFFREELAADGCENYLRKRTLRYRVGGKRRFHVTAHAKRAYVWQSGRFKDDEKLWISKIGAHAEVKPVKGRQALRFYLVSEEDFSRFRQALQTNFQTIEFSGPDELPDIEPEE